MLTLVAFVFMLGVLIFVHELGHYLAAKRIGIRVLTFSLGFGPKIVGFRRGDTEYCISAIPLGGYVKMAGETPDEPRKGDPDEFLSRSKWERFQVLIMGPVMNLALAVVVTTVVLWNGALVPVYQDEVPVVGSVVVGSPAERAGIQPLDRITAIGGQAVSTWDDVFLKIGSKPDREVPVTLIRDGRQMRFPVKTVAKGTFDIGDIGVLPNVHPVIADVSSGSPADKAGIKRGDSIVSIDGMPMSLMQQVWPAISKHAGAPVTLRLSRDGKQFDVQATPAPSTHMIGIRLDEQLKLIKPGFVGAIKMSFAKNYEFAGAIYRTLGGLLTRETSPRQLMGPVAIAQLSGQAAELGWIQYFLLMSMISLNLGLLNLLPIPVLDGGHIFIMAIEGVARRDFSAKVKEKMLLAGFVVLMMLMVTVIYNDLTRIQWIERLMFWR